MRVKRTGEFASDGEELDLGSGHCMARLVSIEFKKVRNVREGTRLTFPTAGAVLLGKNGSGKATLLDYIVALCSINPAAFESEDGFHVSGTFSLTNSAV